MKSWVVHAGILLALCIAVYLYVHRFSPNDPKRRLIAALSGVHASLRPGQAIGYMCRVSDDSVSQDEYHTMQSFADYVMAPVRLDRSGSPRNDTTLIVARHAMGSLIKDSIAGRARVIWEHKDSSYHYLLIY